MKEQIKSEISEFLIHRIRDCRMLVVGDVMLDRYFFGEVTRISPEAPVPITLINRKKDTLGGAANVANNLARLGTQVSMVGVDGNDHHGRLLRREMEKHGIRNEGMILGRDNTTTKTRILGGHQQMLRMDFEESSPLTKENEIAIMKKVSAELANGVNAIIISDYKKGVCSERVCQYIIEKAHEKKCKVFVDPKGRNWEKYRNADYITPNVKETSEVIGTDLLNDELSLRKAAEWIREKYKIDNIIITRSEKGMSLFLKCGEIHIPTVAQDVYDVSGAGDTVISLFSSGIAGGLSEYSSAIMANIAAGICVGKVGTYAVCSNEICGRLNG